MILAILILESSGRTKRNETKRNETKEEDVGGREVVDVLSNESMVTREGRILGRTEKSRGDDDG